MLFLNWYPGVDEPFRSSSLKITICSKRKTRRSLERDRTPASCSVTKKVSCCSSLPWLVSLPCKDGGEIVSQVGRIPPSGESAAPSSGGTDLVSLQSAQVHHVVAQFGDLRHQIYGLLREPDRGRSAHPRSFNRRPLSGKNTVVGFYLDLLTVHARLGAELQEVLKTRWNFLGHYKHSSRS